MSPVITQYTDLNRAVLHVLFLPLGAANEWGQVKHLECSAGIMDNRRYSGFRDAPFNGFVTVGGAR